MAKPRTDEQIKRRREARKRWKEKPESREFINAGKRRHYERYRERELERKRLSRIKHREYYRKYMQRYRARYRAAMLNGASNGAEIRRRILLRDEYFAAALAMVPRGLPPDVRDDMTMEIVLSLLEGTHTLDTAKKSIWSFTPPHYRDRFKTMSLDAPIPGTESLRLIDVIPDRKDDDE